MQPHATRRRTGGWRLWLVAFAVLAACRTATSAPTAVVQTAKGPVRVSLEVVSDDASRARGLMYRNHLDDGHGMLFVFDDESVRSFWMKNTLIPLDMIFIGGDGRIVGMKTDTTPLSLAPLSVGKPSKWVIEVPGGYAGRAGIATGDLVEVPKTF
jgi:uncharacterized membrane protein (UPF0127 family)